MRSMASRRLQRPNISSTRTKKSTSSRRSAPSAACWATTGPPIFQRLFSKGVKLHCHLRVDRIEECRAIARNVWSDHEEALGPYDAFVYAYGGESVCGLEKQLVGKVAHVELIGDCFAPRSLQHAILEGHK